MPYDTAGQFFNYATASTSSLGQLPQNWQAMSDSEKSRWIRTKQPPNWLQMSAGQKAAWTKRARNSVGVPPQSPRAKRRAAGGPTGGTSTGSTTQGSPKAPPYTGRRTRRPTYQAPVPAGPVFTTPKTDFHAKKLECLVLLEETVLLRVTENPQLVKEFQPKWDRYEKVKKHAMGTGTTTPEQATAMRMALVDVIKLVF